MRADAKEQRPQSAQAERGGDECGGLQVLVFAKVFNRGNCAREHQIDARSKQPGNEEGPHDLGERRTVVFFRVVLDARPKLARGPSRLVLFGDLLDRDALVERVRFAAAAARPQEQTQKEQPTNQTKTRKHHREGRFHHSLGRVLELHFCSLLFFSNKRYPSKIARSYFLKKL